MARMRMSMRKIREVLRLTHELGLSVRQVREATGVGKTAVSEYVSRARVIGITWPIPPEITDAELERRLFTPAGFHEGSTKPLPDWTKVHEELKRRGVTLPATPNSYSLLVQSADVTSSVNTLKPASMHGPKEVTIATSVASRPRAINIRPMRGVLWRASNVYQRPPG